MTRPATAFAALTVLTLFAGIAPAQVISFENVAPPGGLININPANPYTEAGYRLTPLGSASAIFDSASATTMFGNPSDWFGFAEGNTITLTRLAGPPFSLTNLLAGPNSLALPNPISLNFVGTMVGGGTLNANFSNLTTATTLNLNWTNLANVTIMGSDDAGIDNINFTPAPEPSSLILAAVALLAVKPRRWRQRVEMTPISVVE